VKRLLYPITGKCRTSVLARANDGIVAELLPTILTIKMAAVGSVSNNREFRSYRGIVGSANCLTDGRGTPHDPV